MMHISDTETRLMEVCDWSNVCLYDQILFIIDSSASAFAELCIDAWAIIEFGAKPIALISKKKKNLYEQLPLLLSRQIEGLTRRIATVKPIF